LQAGVIAKLPTPLHSFSLNRPLREQAGPVLFSAFVMWNAAIRMSALFLLILTGCFGWPKPPEI
jgi:hypothetical protein